MAGEQYNALQLAERSQIRMSVGESTMVAFPQWVMVEVGKELRRFYEIEGYLDDMIHESQLLNNPDFEKELSKISLILERMDE